MLEDSLHFQPGWVLFGKVFSLGYKL